MRTLIAICIIIFFFPAAYADSNSSDVFAFAEKLKRLVIAKDLRGLQRLTWRESRIHTYSEISEITDEEQHEGQRPTAELIEKSDLIYIQAGKRGTKDVAGIIYFIVTPDKPRRRQWLVDYAACAFFNDHGALKLRNGFCFLGTDGAPALDQKDAVILPSQQ